MDRTESTVRKLVTAIEAPLYDIGVLSDRGDASGRGCSRPIVTEILKQRLHVSLLATGDDSDGRTPRVYRSHLWDFECQLVLDY
jgi:hypothetical protein